MIGSEYYNIPIHKSLGFNSKIGDKNINISIFGGSLGAGIFDIEFVKDLSEILSKAKSRYNCSFTVYHQIKDKTQHIQALKNYNENKISANIEQFFVKPESMILKSDILISRSGASSVFEGYVCGAICIFVPIKNSVKNHQLLNAQQIQKLARDRVYIENQNTLIPRLQMILSNL